MGRVRSGDGPPSVRARPSSIKRDCARRPTSTGEKRLVNVRQVTLDAGELYGHSGQRPRARPEPARTGRGPSPAWCGGSRDSGAGLVAYRHAPSPAGSLPLSFPSGRRRWRRPADGARQATGQQARGKGRRTDAHAWRRSGPGGPRGADRERRRQASWDCSPASRRAAEDQRRSAVPGACPISRSTPGTRGHSRTARRQHRLLGGKGGRGGLRIPERAERMLAVLLSYPGEPGAATLSPTLSHESNEADWNVGGPSTCLMS